MTALSRKTALVVGGALLGVMGTLAVVGPHQPSAAAERADQVRDMQQRVNDELAEQLAGPQGAPGPVGSIQDAVDEYIRTHPKEPR